MSAMTVGEFTGETSSVQRRVHAIPSLVTMFSNRETSKGFAYHLQGIHTPGKVIENLVHLV